MNKQEIIGILGLFIFIILGSSIYFNLFSKFKSLPSPLYGGDYYYQMGSINHIREGGNPLSSSSMEGGVPGYMPLYGYLTAMFCNLFKLDTIHGMLYFSIILFIISSLLWFFLFRLLFKNSLLSLIGVLLVNLLSSNIILKYTIFTIKIMIPLFFIFLYLVYRDKKNIFYYLGLGLTYGLISLSHVVAFVGSTLILILYLIFIIIEKKEKIKDTKLLRAFLPNLIIFLLVTLPLILMYWYTPIFKYHLKQTYDRIHMDTPDFSRFDVQIWYLLKTIETYFANFSGIINTIKTVFLWIGIGFLIHSIYSRKITLNEKYILFLFIASLLVNFSFFLTEPLLHKNFIPTYLEQFYLSNVILILCLYGIFRSYKLIDEKTDSIWANIFLISLIIVIFFTSYSNFENMIKNNKWIKTAEFPLPSYLISLKEYLYEKGNVPNDVILTTKELGFSINALTGEKLLVNRWAQQNDPYINLPQRDLDAAVILYGNNTSKKLELLKKYNVSYLYWDYYWPRSEWMFDNNGNVVSYFDPLMSYYTPEREEYLKRNGVKYVILNTNVDPSMRGDKCRKYKLIIITPDNYYNYVHPWKPDIDKYLIPVWNYTYNGKIIARLYKVKLNE